MYDLLLKRIESQAVVVKRDGPAGKSSRPVLGFS
jgi:hypothetical protein